MEKFVTFAFLAVAVLMAGRADGVFISPRHSQVEMKGDWYPELQRVGKETRCHWIEGWREKGSPRVRPSAPL